MIIAATLAALSVPVANLPAENLPEMRPALIGSGPHSFVNLINTEELFRKGQRDAWMMFDCIVLGDGIVSPNFPILCSRSVGAEVLYGAVSKALRNTRFMPAVYNHHRTIALFSGTAIFVVTNGKPHLRVFANQDMEELRRRSDLVAPQPVDEGSGFWGPPTPGHAESLGTRGTVRVRHSVDARGKTTGVEILGELPPGEGFGRAARATILERVYLPAYRNGKPTASTLIYDIGFPPSIL